MDEARLAFVEVIGVDRNRRSVGSEAGRGLPLLPQLPEASLFAEERLHLPPLPHVRHQEPVPLLGELLHDVVHRRVHSGDDADRFPLGDKGRDQVEDRLRLAGSWRAVDHGELV